MDAAHLLRRGVEAHAHFQKMKDPEFELSVPSWGMALFSVTVVLMFVALFSIEYTFGRLIPTLVMVESPQALLFEPLALDDTDATLKNAEPELLLVKQKPITSSFRTTVKHLHSKGGSLARFRGVGLYMVQSVGIAWLSQFLAILPFIPRGTAPVFATLVFANLALTWTHVVISDPSPKPWYKRLPSTHLYKKVVGPTAILAIAQQLAMVIPIYLAFFFGMEEYADPKKLHHKSSTEKSMLALQGLSVVAISIAMWVLVVLPAKVMLTRVQASLLSDSEEAIVPFDRSFGGKVVPEIVGGSGVLGALDAWKTFDWNARVRLIKTYFKAFLMQFALSLFFFVILVAQVVLIVGKSDLKKLYTGEEKVGL